MSVARQKTATRWQSARTLSASAHCITFARTQSSDTLQICDEAQAGTESKALMIVASFVSLILSGEFIAK